MLCCVVCLKGGWSGFIEAPEFREEKERKGLHTGPRRNNTHPSLLQNPEHLLCGLGRTILVIWRRREPEVRNDMRERLALKRLQLSHVQDFGVDTFPLILFDMRAQDVEHAGRQIRALDARGRVLGLDESRHEACAAGVVEDVGRICDRGGELGKELLGYGARAARRHAIVCAAVRVVEGFRHHGGGLEISLVGNRGKGAYARDVIRKDAACNPDDFGKGLRKEIGGWIIEHDGTF